MTRPGLKHRPLDLESSTLTINIIRPMHLPHCIYTCIPKVVCGFFKIVLITVCFSIITGEQLDQRIKPDYNLISVNDRVVPLELDHLGSPNAESDLVQCSSTALQSDNQQTDAQDTPPLRKPLVSSSSLKQRTGVLIRLTGLEIAIDWLPMRLKMPC